MRSLLRDAREGLTVTRLLLRETVQKPTGLVSADFRYWLLPTIAAVFALMPIVGAVGGTWAWLEAALGSLALLVLSAWLFARLARRCERDYPEVWRRM